MTTPRANVPPNILLLMTDQQSAAAMSCAGNVDLHTPTMDKLAAAGVRFDRTYCTFPLCTPARASLFTGRMPCDIRVMGNGLAIPEQFRAQELGSLLSAAGYACGYGGKWHVPEISMPAGHGFEALCPMDDDNLADACIRYLHRRHERPFLLVASFDNPHNICEWARNQVLPWGNIPAVPVEQCPNLPANHAIPPFEPEVIRLFQAAVPRMFPGRQFSSDRWRQYRDAYFRLVEKVDRQIGRILTALDESGMAEQTLVVFTSDHGDGMGAHQWNQKVLLYDESARVPLIVRPPGRRIEGRVMKEALISNGLDLLPTLCDYAGAAAPADLPGRSLRPLLEGRPVAWRDHLVVTTRLEGLGAEGRALITARHKYVVFSWGQHREQLFDLVTDPGEMVNLAVEQSKFEILDHHRRLLHAWCRESGDRFETHNMHPGQSVGPGREYTPNTAIRAGEGAAAAGLK